MPNSGRFNVTLGTVLSLALVLAQAPAALAQNKHTLPLFVSASHSTLQGFARIINLSDRDGDVTIHAIDDTGQRSGPVTLSLEAKETRHFNSDDLRDGHAEKGLSGGVGSGQGNWRLELETDLDIDPLIYTRPRGEGFVTSTHDVVAEGESMRWRVPFFNPGNNTAQQSWLRVVNTSGIDTKVTVEGIDDNGAAGTGVVSFDLAADAARMLSAQEIEEGSADSTFDGRLGDRTGKWQLFVSADQPIQVMSLLLSESGHLTNLSTSSIARDRISSEFAPVDQPAFDARFVGKRVIFADEPGFYWDVVSSGRLDVDESEGTYAYQKIGTNAGGLETMFGADDRCLAPMTFDSTTTGTIAFACAEDGYELETPGRWRLVDIPVAGLAPANQAEFDALVVGKRATVRYAGGTIVYNFPSAGNFHYEVEGIRLEGRYTYVNTGPNTGTVTFDYTSPSIVKGEVCTGRLTFETRISGRVFATCTSGIVGAGEGRVEFDPI